VDETSRAKPIKGNVEKYRALQARHNELRDRIFR